MSNGVRRLGLWLGMWLALTVTTSAAKDSMRACTRLTTLPATTEPEEPVIVAGMVDVRDWPALHSWKEQQLIGRQELAQMSLTVGLGGEIGASGVGSRTVQLQQWLALRSRTVVFDRSALKHSALRSEFKVPEAFRGELLPPQQFHFDVQCICHTAAAAAPLVDQCLLVHLPVRWFTSEATPHISSHLVWTWGCCLSLSRACCRCRVGQSAPYLNHGVPRQWSWVSSGNP